MEQFDIQSTQKYMPTVSFNPETGVLELTGQCYMENTDHFFKPIFAWIDEYLQTPRPHIALNIKLSYFNTSAVKCIWETLNRLAKYNARTGHEVNINWYYDEDDDNMHDIYLDFQEEINLPFHHIQTDE